MSHSEANGLSLDLNNDSDRRNNFLKALPKSRIPGLVRGLLLHASRSNLDYGGRTKSLDSLQTIIGYHAAELVRHNLVEPILRGASKIIVAGCHGSLELAPLLHSAGAMVLTLGSKVDEIHLLPLLVAIIEEYIKSAEDCQRHCAMVLIGNCISFYGNNIGSWADGFWVHLTSGIQDMSAEVRQTACFSLGFWTAHPELVMKVAPHFADLAPTILNLCQDPYTAVAACTVLIPLMERRLIRGHDHDAIALSSRLLETLPRSLKFLSVNIMGCAATSLGAQFLPYFHSCMRRLWDFSLRYEQADMGLRLMVISTISSFSKVVGKEAFHPYLGDAIHNVLQGLFMDPPQLTEPSLFFVGSMARLYDIDLFEHLPKITNAIHKLASMALMDHEEEALAGTALQIVQRIQGDIFAFAEHYLDVLQTLSHRPCPSVRKIAIHALFQLTLMLQHIRDIRILEEKRFCLEIRAKHILLDADTSGIGFSVFFDQQPVTSDKSLNLDIILTDIDMDHGTERHGHFPASTLLFSTTASSSKPVLDLSQFMPILLERCGPQYCSQVQQHAFVTIADVLETADEASWTSIEPLVFRLIILLYRGLRHGRSDVRPAAIIAISRLIERTRLDLSMLYPSLLRPLCYALLGSGLPDSTVQVAARTISLLISRNPSAVQGGLAIDALVTSLTSTPDIRDVIVVFKGLQVILDANNNWKVFALAPWLVQELLRSYACIIGAHASQAVVNTSTVTQTLLCVLFGADIDELRCRNFHVEISQNELKIAINGHISHRIQLGLPWDGPFTISKTSPIVPKWDYANNYSPFITRSRHPHRSCAYKLPPEVMAQIMALCLPQGRDWDLAGAEDIPYVLGQINGQWRQVALYTPKIWDSLDIDLNPGLHEVRSRRVVSAVEIWLERSGGLPITIFIKCLAAGSSSTFHSNLERLMRSLVPFSRFWKDVQLHIPFLALQELYTAHRSHQDMPRLRTLSLISSTFGFGAGQSPLFLRSAPLLQALTLRHVGLQLDILEIPWDQLTSLSLKVTGWTARQCVHALRECRRLRFLHLNAVWMPHERYQGEIICLPSLEVLHVNNGLSHLIPSLDLPRLHEMKTEHPGFSVTLKWINSGFTVFLAALSAFKKRGVIPPTTIDQLRGDRQDRRFAFTILDPTVLDSTPLSRALPTLGTLAQYMGIVEIDCSLCMDQTILDIIAYVRQELSSAPVYNVRILVHRAGGEAVAANLTPYSEDHEYLSLEMKKLGLEIYISRSMVHSG